MFLHCLEKHEIRDMVASAKVGLPFLVDFAHMCCAGNLVPGCMSFNVKSPSAAKVATGSLLDDSSREGNPPPSNIR